LPLFVATVPLDMLFVTPNNLQVTLSSKII